MTIPFFVDVHTHLDDSKFDSDRQEVIDRAVQLGCKKIINNATNTQSLLRCIALQEQYSIFATAGGLYPGEAEEDFFEQLERVKDKIIAIGEIGLDYTYTHVTKEEQQRVFKKQLALAKKWRKIPIIHSRQAEEDVVELLDQPAIMHCYCGTVETAKKALKKGCYFSIPPRIVIDTQFQELVKALPLSRLLTETDAPYMGPSKGKRNEPSTITQTIEKIAELKGTDLKETALVLFANYKNVFRS